MEPTEPNSGQAPGTAEATGVPADISALLEKKAAGQSLTPAENGKVGAFARWFPKWFGGKSGEDTQPAPRPRGAPFGRENALAAIPSAETSADCLEPVEIDDGLCKRTTAAVIGRANTWAVGWIEREAKASAQSLPADKRDTIIDRFRVAASLPVADQKLLIDISPDVFRELGLDPRQFAVWTAAGVLGFHAVNLWQCVGELRDMRKEQNKPVQEAAPKPAMPAAKIVEPPNQ